MSTGDLLMQGQKYAADALKKQWQKEKKSLKSRKSKKQPLGDKDDPVDEIVRLAASCVGTVSEAYQYRKEKTQAARNDEEVVQKGEDVPREDIGALSEETEWSGTQVASQQPSRRGRSLTLGEGERRREKAGEETRDDLASPTLAYDFGEAPWRADEDHHNESEIDPCRDEADVMVSNDGETSDRISAAQVKAQKPGDFAREFIKRHPLDPATMGKRSPIELPVVIPQRRPKNRGRGFVRAYSPVLATVGIEQPEFLDFIDSFNRALVPSEWIQAIELVGWAGTAAPEPIAILLDQALEMAVEAATEAQSRYRGGRYIDRVNAEYFIPRGLVAMIVTWKSWDDHSPKEANRPAVSGAGASEQPRASQTLRGGVSFEGAEIVTRERNLDPDTGFTKSWKDLRSRRATPVDVRTRLHSHMQQRMKRYHGVFQCPETAPLVFPSFSDDHAVMVTKNNGKRMNGFQRGEQWINGLRDRRAQVKWAAKTLDSKASATTQQHEFRSRYANPSHPAASGDIVAFATGGKWSTRGRVTQGGLQEDEEGMSSGEERTEEKWLRKKEKEDLRKKEKAKERAEKGKKGDAGLGSLLRTDVLYLVIMNLPSADERPATARLCQQIQESGALSPGSDEESEQPTRQTEEDEHSAADPVNMRAYDRGREYSRRDELM